MSEQRKTPEALASGVLVTKLEGPAKQFGDAPDRHLARSLNLFGQPTLVGFDRISLNRWRLIISTYWRVGSPPAADTRFTQIASDEKDVCTSIRILV